MATATPPGKPDGQPSPVTMGGYIKDPPPPSLPKPPEVWGGLWTPEGTAGVGELPPIVVPPEPEPPAGFDPYPTVTRAMPGANTDPLSPHCGNFKVGRTSGAAVELASTAVLPAGIDRDDVGQNINVTSAVNGGELTNIDFRGGWTISFGPGVDGFTIRQCIFDNGIKSVGPYYSVIDAYNNAPTALVISDNDFLGLKSGAFEPALAAWITVGAEPVDIIRNVSLHPPGDHWKTEGGLIEENYCYGGGTTPEAHFDFVQVQQLNSPLTIVGNVFNGIGDGDTNGGTNIVRAVPNDSTQGPKAFPIEVYDNIMLGMGHQLENDNTSYTAAAYHTNWQDQWAYSPHQIVATASVSYFDNHVLSTGEPIPDVTL